MAENHSESVWAFLVGAAVGAAVGVLLAPCSGEETRRRLAGWLQENREKTVEFLEKEKEVLQAKKEQLASAWEAGKKAYKDAA